MQNKNEKWREYEIFKSLDDLVGVLTWCELALRLREEDNPDLSLLYDRRRQQLEVIGRGIRRKDIIDGILATADALSNIDQ